MTFVGSIQLNETPEALKKKIQQTELRYNDSIAKERLLQESGDDQSLESNSDLSESDFVFVTYRAISATTLADRPIDFSNDKMLKRSVAKLKGQTVFKDHETSVDNWVGRVDSTLWDEDTKGLPPGINAVLKLDTVKDPMTVRGVLQGAIHSASVTVSFEWKPSHPKLMDEGSFFDFLGDEVDGEMVRVVVTKIEKYWEISLVWQGADEFAKQIGVDGRPVHQSVQDENLMASQFGCCPINQEEKQEDHMEKLNALLKETFGIEVTEKNFKEVLQKHINALTEKLNSKASEEISKLVSQLNEANDKLAKLESDFSDLKPQAELGSKYLEDERAETIRLYKLAKDNTTSEAILKTLEKADLETVQAFKKEFTAEVESKFPSKCKRCGSTEISRQSSAEQNESGQDQSQTKLNQETASRVKDLHAI